MYRNEIKIDTNSQKSINTFEMKTKIGYQIIY